MFITFKQTFSDLFSKEDSESEATGQTLCNPPRRDFSLSRMSQFNPLSQTNQPHNIGTHSSQQRTPPLPGTSSTNLPRRSSAAVQAQTSGAAPVFTTSKLAYHSSSTPSSCQTQAETPASIIADSNYDEDLLDDLPYDFNDFSDGNMSMEVNDIHTSTSENVVSQVDTKAGGFTSTTAPKESSIFNKICEGMVWF